MICTKCGNEKFITVRVYRNRAKDINLDKWIFDGNRDIRMVMCEDCGLRYYTETKILSEFYYDEVHLKKMEKRKDIKQFNIFKANK